MTRIERIKELDEQINVELKKILNREDLTKRVSWKKVNELGYERDKLIIEENKANYVYWDYDIWVYDKVKEIPQNMELTGQERTREFVKSLNELHGCYVSEDKAGYTLEIFTPYKVYIYRFNRGYGTYPITISKGFIAPSGNTYSNKIFLAKNTKEMKENYHNH